MPFPFTLPTTSHLSFQQHFTSPTHPSLPSTATSQRNLVRSTLKTHKRLPSASQPTNLSEIHSALTTYLRTLNTLDQALSSSPTLPEEITLAPTSKIEVAWRPTLTSSSLPGRPADRIEGHGLDYEIYALHQTSASLHTLLARQALLNLYTNPLPSPEQRLSHLQNAIRHLKTAYSIHSYLVTRSTTSADGPPTLPVGQIDISLPVQTALQHLAHAELNLLSALKDDPYPAIVIQSRDASDREWMIKAPEIPKSRAQLLTRLCMGAAEHAGAAGAGLKSEKGVSKELVEYAEDLRRVARARACRFQGVDADARGETGKAVAWIYAGAAELGVEVEINTKSNLSKTSKFDKLKASFNERREDKRLAKGSARWGSDAGKAEEARILEYLERKMIKANETVHFQKVPEFKGLMGTLPSGMNLPLGDEKWKVVVLEEGELMAMRAPPDLDALGVGGSGESSGNEIENEGGKGPAGAFPGSEGEYKNNYY